MSQLNLDQARFNMVEQQIRTWEVLDPRVLDLMLELPRDAFVPEKFRNLAYADIAIPLGGGKSMLHPKYEAHALQALRVQPTDKILEVGTGSGYFAALLAKSGHQVVSVDSQADLQNQAANRLKKFGITNVTLEQGDASRGWDKHAPYNAIVLSGSVAELADSLKRQLAVGGRLFAVIGKSPVMEACLITRVSDNEWHNEVLFETDIPALPGASEPPKFQF